MIDENNWWKWWDTYHYLEMKIGPSEFTEIKSNTKGKFWEIQKFTDFVSLIWTDGTIDEYKMSLSCDTCPHVAFEICRY